MKSKSLLQHRLGLLCALGLGLLAAPGCRAIKKTRECRAFVDKVNVAVQEIIEEGKIANNPDGKQMVEGMKKVAARYERLAADIGTLEVQTPELKAKLEEYQGLCAKTAKAARDVVEAVEKSDPEKAAAAQEAFSVVSKQEVELVKSVNAFCQTP